MVNVLPQPPGVTQAPDCLDPCEKSGVCFNESTLLKSARGEGCDVYRNADAKDGE